MCSWYFLSDFAEPMGVFGVAAIDDVKVRALDFFGDRAAAADIVALAQFDAVEFANRGDFSRGAGKERFITDINLVTGDPLLNHFQPQVFGNVEDGVAG